MSDVDPMRERAERAEAEVERLRVGLLTLRAVLDEPYAAQVDDPDGNRERVEQVEDALADLLNDSASAADCSHCGGLRIVTLDLDTPPLACPACAAPRAKGDT